MGFLAQQKWLFYDTLLSLIPPAVTVKSCVVGPYWTLVESDQGAVGLAHRLSQNLPAEAPSPDSLTGRPLVEVAQLVKSWDLTSAALGLAAINAAANARLSSLVATRDNNYSPRGGCAFDFFLDRVRGRRVTVVGHFPNLEKMAQVADLTILERQPRPGDWPDPAAEYILDEQQAVFLTGTTIINKTLPRLLELAQGRDIFLVGPSVPMFPELFKFGFTSLSGTLIIDFPAMAAAVAQGCAEEIFERGGLMVNLLREDYV
ncbi:MAG: DUF364 domain-containing protein [Deltaproteobacteria bacterium]|jgi:uncharacterized protein (DUF4213/DUF364 family)|nr:DUF364 domain-containing protein [Deltaproteobacteria bacterium]